MADDGKRSLYSGGGDGDERAADGKRALYSGEESGPVKIDCARCGTTSEIGILDALMRILRFSLWIPGRTYSRRLECPACQRRSWVRVRLT